MCEIREISANIRDAIYNTTKLYYQNKIEEGNQELDNSLNVITNGIDCIFKILVDNNTQVDDIKLVEILSRSMYALENNDFVLLSDILNYELTAEVTKLELILSNT